MDTRPDEGRMPLLLWPVLLVLVVVGMVAVTAIQFTGSFNGDVPVTLSADRAGLVMETGAKVKLRGVEVGRVVGIEGGREPVSIKLQLFSDAVRFIPANVQAQIDATTAFGAKFVNLVYPDQPSSQRISAGAVVVSSNTATEVNTVFQNLVQVLDQIDPAKLNAVLSAVSQALRGQGQRIGEATTAANQVLLAVNPRMDTVREDLRSLKGVADTYSAAANDILATVNAATTTSATITTHAKALDSLLVNLIGFGNTAVNFLAPNQKDLVDAINILQPTTSLLMKYNPEYTCLLMGSKWYLDHGGRQAIGGNGKSVIVDATLLLGADPYRYPDNLPIVAAKGGPGGQPGCGSLPDATKNFPVRQLVTNTGWGTGVDIRPNPGIGFPGYADYLPATRAIPEPPSIRHFGPPAPGPFSYPGGPAYGAPQFGPDGAPLYPPPPGVPPPPPAPAAESPPPQAADVPRSQPAEPPSTP
jgi:phospholipid/cholesterol/gamma-HCH transport system substrate-binding protein